MKTSDMVYLNHLAEPYVTEPLIQNAGLYDIEYIREALAHRELQIWCGMVNKLGVVAVCDHPRMGKLSLALVYPPEGAQITGLAEMFADREFSEAWEMDAAKENDDDAQVNDQR